MTEPENFEDDLFDDLYVSPNQIFPGMPSLIAYPATTTKRPPRPLPPQSLSHPGLSLLPPQASLRTTRAAVIMEQTQPLARTRT